MSPRRLPGQWYLVTSVPMVSVPMVSALRVLLLRPGPVPLVRVRMANVPAVSVLRTVPTVSVRLPARVPDQLDPNDDLSLIDVEAGLAAVAAAVAN